MISIQRTIRILMRVFAQSKWPHFHSAYVIGVCVSFFATAVVSSLLLGCLKTPKFTYLLSAYCTSRVVVAFLLTSLQFATFFAPSRFKIASCKLIIASIEDEVAKIWTDLKRHDSTFFAAGFMYFNTWEIALQSDSYYIFLKCNWIVFTFFLF